MGQKGVHNIPKRGWIDFWFADEKKVKIYSITCVQFFMLNLCHSMESAMSHTQRADEINKKSDSVFFSCHQHEALLKLITFPWKKGSEKVSHGDVYASNWHNNPGWTF